MTTPGERFGTWINGLAVSWRDAVGLWAGSFIAKGFLGFADVVGKSFAPKIKPIMDKIEANTTIPPELQKIWDEMKEPTGEVAALFASRIGGGLVSGTISALIEWMLRPLQYGLSHSPGYFLAKPEVMIEQYRRGMLSKNDLFESLRFHGIDPVNADKLLRIGELRFPSEIVNLLWLRDKAKYGKFWEDVYTVAGIEHLAGAEDERILALQELAYRIPGVQDIIRYVVKEAYNEDVYKAFGQDQEYPGMAEADAEKAGVRPDMLLKEWIAHWDLPSVGNGFEMLHRGEITQQELTILLKARDIMPFWRKGLTAISWSVPSRIEVRMMAQLGLVNKDYIMDILEKDGLAEEYRSTVADMNLVRGIRSDLQTRYSKKWIDSAGVKAEIEKSGLSPEIGQRLYEWIVTNTAGDRTAVEKDLTAAEIIKGVKKGMLTWSEGVQQLIALGYDEIEADYKLAIDIEVVETVPTTELNTRVDTIRRRRRERLIFREEEISSFLDLGIDVGVATAYADNDDLRLIKVAAVKPPEVKMEYQTDDGKIKVETIRLSRRQRRISRDEEIMGLMELEMSNELAIAAADNDDLRLAAVKPPVPVVVMLLYQTEAGRVEVETIRLSRRQRQLYEELTSAQIAQRVVPRLLTGDEAHNEEVRLLKRLDMPDELAIAYADNDDLRLIKETTGG